MNTLQSKMLEVIENEDEGFRELSESCTTIAIEFAVSFLVWATLKGIIKDSKKEYWYCESNGLYYTTEQLIENYLQTLK